MDEMNGRPGSLKTPVILESCREQGIPVTTITIGGPARSALSELLDEVAETLDKIKAAARCEYQSDEDDHKKTLIVDWVDEFYTICDQLEAGPEDLSVDGHEYKNKRHQQFVRDMKKAIEDGDLDEELQHYRGRFYYEGPAVSCKDPQEVLSRTKVPCQWDSMGRGVIVYPK